MDTKLVAADTGTPVEIDFDARVLRSGSRFEMRVFNSALPLEVRQTVTDGDADDLVEGNTTAVITSADVSSLLDVVVTPKVFTPNGDDVNDVTLVSYDLLEILGASAVKVAVSDLRALFRYRPDRTLRLGVER